MTKDYLQYNIEEQEMLQREQKDYGMNMLTEDQREHLEIELDGLKQDLKTFYSNLENGMDVQDLIEETEQEIKQIEQQLEY